MSLSAEALRCAESPTLTEEEKEVFRDYLSEQDLDLDIWDFFNDLARMSTRTESFFYVKVLSGSRLVGLGLIAKVEHYNPYRALRTDLRRFKILENILMVSRLFGRNVMYCSMSEILCANLDSPLFCQAAALREPVTAAIISHLRNKPDSAYVVVMDSTRYKSVYENEGYAVFPYCSSSWIDATRYKSIEDYYSKHKKTSKRLAWFRQKRGATVEVETKVISGSDVKELRRCLASSAKNTRSVIPFQDFFDTYILDTEAFHSSGYVHIIVRRSGTLVGFTTFKSCGRHLGAILGGFDRQYTRNSPVYDMVMVSALEYALQKGYKRVYYGIVNNFTKARLTDSYEPLSYYFYSRFWLYRKLQRWLYFVWTPHELHTLERQSLHEPRPENAKR